MARFTSIDRLPPEIRDLIAQRRRVERRTIAAISQELQELGYRMPKSTLARHTRHLDAAELAARRAGTAPILAELVGIRTALEALLDHLRAPKPPL